MPLAKRGESLCGQGHASFLPPTAAGSGKSNIMDAISFALCVNAKALRCDAIKDLVYVCPGARLFMPLTITALQFREVRTPCGRQCIAPASKGQA